MEANNVLATVVRYWYASTLGKYEDFPLVHELEDICSSQGLNAKEEFYKYLGYESKGGYSTESVCRIRELAIKVEHETLMKEFRLSSVDEINELISKSGSNPDITKKLDVPSDWINEVLCLSLYIRDNKDIIFRNGQGVLQSTKGVVGYVPAVKADVDTFAGNWTEFFSSTFELMPLEDNMKETCIKNRILYTNNVTEVNKSKLTKLAIKNCVVPLVFMPANVAYDVVKNMLNIFHENNLGLYHTLLGYLYNSNLNFNTICKFLGFKYPDFVDSFNKTGTIVQKIEDFYIVSNDNVSRLRLSAEEFNLCLSKGYLANLSLLKNEIVIYDPADKTKYSTLNVLKVGAV